MKYRNFIGTTIAVLMMLITSVSMASSFGTADEAKDMLERAIIAMKADQAAALEAFNTGSNGFKDRDLYVACFMQGAGEGILTAHGGVPTLVGTSGYDLVDKKGNNLGTLLNHDTAGKIATATYWFPRPGSDEPVEKESFYATIGDQNCLVGYYK